MMDLAITAGIIVAVLGGILGLIVTALKLAGKTSIPDLLRRSGSAETHPPLVPATPPASSEPTPWLGRPASLGTSFVGREDDIRTLESLLREHQGTVLCGGPGTGKSRLAAELTYVRGGPGFWANGAETAERTLGGLAMAFGVDVEGKDDADIAAEVRRCLAAEPPDALVVFDNVPDLAQTNALLDAAGQMRVLITTRDVRESARPAHVGRHLVEVLDSQSAIVLLETQAPNRAGDESLRGIAEAVGHLPLALMVLGATLREPLCYLADLPVPDGLARALTGIGDDTDAYGRWLGECQRHAVLIKEPGHVRVHALTAAAVRATNADAALETAVASAATRLDSISLPDPVATRGELAHYEALKDRAERELDAMHPSRLHLEHVLGSAYGYLGRAAESIAVFEARTKRFEDTLGPEHHDTLGSKANLAVAYQRAGRTEEAIALQEENLLVTERVLGAKHPSTLASRNNLAGSYQEAGHTKQAISLHEENLPVMEEVMGAEHRDTLASQSNLAVAYQAAGRTEEANTLYEENLLVTERVLGSEHPDTLASRNNLANGYRQAGRAGDAIVLHEQNLPVMEHVLGAEHPHTLLSRGSLELAYRAVGRDADADRLMAGRDEDGNLG